MKDRELRVMYTGKKSNAQNVSSDKNKQAVPKLKAFSHNPNFRTGHLLLFLRKHGGETE